jgi:hypothetical protein
MADVDERRKLRARTPQLPGAQVPAVIYAVDHLTGQLVGRRSTTEGITWFSDGNSRPRPASRLATSTRDVSEGGFSMTKQPPPIPPEKRGAGVDGLLDDPNPDPAVRRSTPGRYREDR